MALMMAAILRGERGHPWGPVVAAGPPPPSVCRAATVGTIIAIVAIFSSGCLVELRQVLSGESYLVKILMTHGGRRCNFNIH